MAKKNKFLEEHQGVSFIHWAIVCHLKPHQLAYRINLGCSLQLKRLRNLLPKNTKSTLGFALFNCQLDEMQPDFYLISLKDDQLNLVKGLRQFDYLLQIRITDEDTKWDQEHLIRNLRKIENVLGVFDINVDTLKDSDVLFFDKNLDALNMINEEVKEVDIKRIIR